MKEILKSLQDMIGFTISFLDDLLKKYGHFYPRQTEITNFSEVSIRNVALSNLVVAYNRKSGFMGHQIKEEDPKEDMSVTCSEYDRLLLIFSDGLYKIIPAVEKLYVGPDLQWFGIIEKDIIFNIVYRDGAENYAYLKRFTTPSFILEKEYRLFPEHKRSRILHLEFGEHKYVKIYLVPSSRARTNNMEISFDDFLIKNVGAKGKRLSNRVVRKVIPSTGSNPEPVKQILPLPGLDSQKKGGEEEIEGEE